MPLSSLAPATRGTNIAEYGLLAALVSVIAIGAILGMGNQVRRGFAGSGEILGTAIETGGLQPLQSGTPLITFELTVGRNGTNTGYVSSDAELTLLQFGSVNYDTAPLTDVRRLQETAGPREVWFYLDGDYRTEIVDWTLQCNGTDLRGSDGHSVTLVAGETQIRWTDPVLDLVDGFTYSCHLIDPTP